jgi:primosomal protein N' (replication factor Y)
MSETGSYAEVIVDIPVREMDHVFHYAVPAGMREDICFGCYVLVPLGARQVNGYVVGFSEPAPDVRIKEIVAIKDKEPVFSPDLLELARWLAEYYLSTTARALQWIIAPRLRIRNGKKKAGTMSLWPGITAEEAAVFLSKRKRAHRQAAVMRLALACPGLSRRELAAAADVSCSTVDALVARGWLKNVENHAHKRHFAGLPQTFQLNDEQAAALQEIEAALSGNRPETFLLHGITGSGKTSVYLEAIARAMELGRQAMALVPEIALTPQMVRLFQERFGERVALLHSKLTDRERYDEWRRIERGEAPVVLGTRSAVFAPLADLGLIVIDEEHETSYKQEDHLRYHARDVAEKRAKLSGAVLVLGSATPSLESYHKALAGDYRLLKLGGRVDGRKLPGVRVVDLRQELQEGNRGIFSRALKTAIEERLGKGEQAILFLNRRGFATFVVCRECGLVLKCPRCDISLTYHISGHLRCHYCNYVETLPDFCPKCKSRYIRHFGVGTQKVEEEVRLLFPRARLLRMDSDTTAYKNAHRDILARFCSGEADILIGTQMIAKGLDIHRVTLVGVINADATLHMPEFRAGERTFQLLTQVAGRAGRGEWPGEVVVQTYCPEHYCIIAASSHDYEQFYESEIKIRRSMNYPPFTRLARVLLAHERQDLVKQWAAILAERLQQAAGERQESVDVLGPAPAPLSRLKEKYRWQLILRGTFADSLRAVIKTGLDGFEKVVKSRDLLVHVDIDPLGMS